MISLRSLLACTALVAVGLPAAAEAQSMSPEASRGVGKSADCVMRIQQGGSAILEHFDGAWRLQPSNPLLTHDKAMFVKYREGFWSMLRSDTFDVTRACNTAVVSGCGNSAVTGPWMPDEGQTLPLGGSAYATLTCQSDGSYSVAEGGDCEFDDPDTAANERLSLADAGGASWSAAPNDDYIPLHPEYSGPPWNCSPGSRPDFPPPETGTPPFTQTPGGVTIGGGKAFRCRNELGNPTGEALELVGDAGNFAMTLESPFGRVAAIHVVYNPETLQLISYGPADPSHPARMCFNPDLEQDDFVSCDDSFNRFNAPRVSGQRQSGWWAAYFTGGKGQDRCDTEDPETLEPNTVAIDGVAYTGVTYNCGSPIICAIEDE